LKFGLICLALFAPLTVLAEMARSATLIPFYDQWDTSLTIASAAVDGGLTPELLLRQHNEHRLLFTNLTTASAAVLTRWNMAFELGVIVILAAAVVALALLIIRRQRPGALWIALVPFTALIFAVTGRHTFLTGFQTCFLYPVVFVMLALWILQRRPPGWRPLLLAALMNVAATFSLGSGMVAWIALIPTLWLLGYRRVLHYVTWGIIAAVAIALYFNGLIADSATGGLQLVLQQPLAALQYVLTYLGGPFVYSHSESVDLAMIISAGGLLLYAANLVVALRRRQAVLAAPWVGLAAFAVGLALLTMLGRLPIYLNVDRGQALSERYVIHAALFWIALVALAILNLPTTKIAGRRLTILNGTASLILSVLYIAAAARTVETESFISRANDRCFLNYLYLEGPTDCFSRFYSTVVAVEDGRFPLIEAYVTHRFGPLAADSLAVPLTMDTLAVIHNVETEMRFASIDGRERSVLFQHPNGEVEQRLHVPDEDAAVVLQTSIYVDTTNVRLHPEVPENGVEFRVNVVTPDGSLIPLAAQVFDPALDQSPLPLRIDLTPYRGQTIGLRLATDARDDATFDWAMWVEPVLIFTRAGA